MEYGNLAYKLEEKQEKVKMVKRAPKPKQKLNVKFIMYAIVISMAAYFMISKQVAVFETEKEVSKLQTQLETLKTTEVQKNFELEQSVDLSTVEEIATTKLNMQRPEQSQKVYIDVTGEDVTEVTANETEGVKNKVSGAAKSLKKNIMGIFSLGW